MFGALCCAGQVCCSCLCGACMRCCGTTHQQHMRIGYFVLMIFAIAFGTIFLYFGGDLMSPWEEFGLADCDGDDQDLCLGVQTIYRESFALVLFFLTMIIFTLPGGKISSIFNCKNYIEGCWLLKIVIISTYFIITFFIPNSFFDGYREFSRYFSVLFLIYQIVIIIDFAYSWNDKWIANYEDSGESGYWSFCLFFISGIMWVISLTLIILCYYWFSTDHSCGLNIFLITLTLALGISFTMLSLTNCVAYGCKLYLALLTSSVVNLYIVYLCWYALTSDSSSCNTWTDTTSTGVTILFGSIVMFIMLMYLSFRQKKKSDDEAPIRGAAEPLVGEDDETGEHEAYNDDEEADERRMVYFLLVMAASAVYLAMLLTDWGAADIGGERYNKEGLFSNDGSMWVKFAAIWVTVILYVWSLIAPKVCSNRDFS